MLYVPIHIYLCSVITKRSSLFAYFNVGKLHLSRQLFLRLYLYLLLVIIALQHLMLIFYFFISNFLLSDEIRNKRINIQSWFDEIKICKLKFIYQFK